MQKLDRTGTASRLVSFAWDCVCGIYANTSSYTSFFMYCSFTGSTAASVLGQNSGQVLPGLTAASFSMPALTPSIDAVGVPSECLLLKNMFDPSSEVCR